MEKDNYGDEVRTNFWKERGKGWMRVLRNRTTNKCRVLMRQDETKKVCVNHVVDPTLPAVSGNVEMLKIHDYGFALSL